MARRFISQDSGDEIVSEINVTSLVDVSLVLLVIFMVTASYISTSSFLVDMPKAVHGSDVFQEDAVTISVTREGPMYLDDKLVNTAELKKEMKQKFQNNPRVGVILSADKGTYFQDVVSVLDLLSGIGINRLNIATEKETKQ